MVICSRYSITVNQLLSLFVQLLHYYMELQLHFELGDHDGLSVANDNRYVPTITYLTSIPAILREALIYNLIIKFIGSS